VGLLINTENWKMSHLFLKFFAKKFKNRVRGTGREGRGNHCSFGIFHVPFIALSKLSVLSINKEGQLNDVAIADVRCTKDFMPCECLLGKQNKCKAFTSPGAA
jgi:hypothetical protein